MTIYDLEINFDKSIANYYEMISIFLKKKQRRQPWN